jgi:hypothetical protein
MLDAQQIHVVDYPVADRPATVEEAVLTEAQYYISVLARHQRARNDEEDDYENIAEDDVAIIEVADLMSFTRLQQACNNDAELLGYRLCFFGSSVHFLHESRALIQTVGLITRLS